MPPTTTISPIKEVAAAAEPVRKKARLASSFANEENDGGDRASRVLQLIQDVWRVETLAQGFAEIPNDAWCARSRMTPECNADAPCARGSDTRIRSDDALVCELVLHNEPARTAFVSLGGAAGAKQKVFDVLVSVYGREGVAGEGRCARGAHVEPADAAIRRTMLDGTFAQASTLSSVVTQALLDCTTTTNSLAMLTLASSCNAGRLYVRSMALASEDVKAAIAGSRSLWYIAPRDLVTDVLKCSKDSGRQDPFDAFHAVTDWVGFNCQGTAAIEQSMGQFIGATDSNRAPHPHAALATPSTAFTRLTGASGRSLYASVVSRAPQSTSTCTG